MCTSIVVNKGKTIVGWNLDILNMEHRVRATPEGVFIEFPNEEWGWLPFFGANSRGDFVGMPTCWPYDSRSEATNSAEGSNGAENANGTESSSGAECSSHAENIMMLDIDLLLQRKTLGQIKDFVEASPDASNVYSNSGFTFMGALSDANGNVLHIVPGQGSQYFEKPAYKILANFSPYKQNSEKHPWMGWDRYHTAKAMIEEDLADPSKDDFTVADCFEVLKAVSQEVCPTMVSMVFNVTDRVVYWCINRNWDDVQQYAFA